MTALAGLLADPNGWPISGGTPWWTRAARSAAG
jgi:hypothetical protein